MTPLAFLNAVRRRWAVVTAAFLLSLVASWLVTSDPRPAPPSTTSYRARVVLLNEGTGAAGVGAPGISSLQTIAALVTIGEVPKRAARVIGSDDPSALAENVTAAAEGGTGFLIIEARAPTGPRAEQLADVFAAQLLDFLVDRRVLGIQEQLESLSVRIKDLQRQIRQGPPGQTSRLAGTMQQLIDQREQLKALNPDSGLEIIDRSPAEAIGTETIQAPRGRRTQILAAGVIGLILGIGLALLLERFDQRIQTKQVAEQHFTFPVIAEIPSLPRAARARLLLDAPKSPQANAFRLLAATMTGRGELSREAEGNGGHRHETVGGPPTSPLLRSAAPRVARKDPPSVILVTSAGPQEGKTTVVANLAAAFAEGRKSVTVVSCDLRRPAIHTALGVPNEHGLTEALVEDPPGRVLNGHIHPSQFTGITVVPSGSHVDRPGELLSSPRLRQALAEAKRLSDVVLVDSAPLLTASESTHLLGLVDAVLVVARAGRITPVVAERTSEVLRRLGAPVVGVALTFARETPVPSDRRLPW